MLLIVVTPGRKRVIGNNPLDGNDKEVERGEGQVMT